MIRSRSRLFPFLCAVLAHVVAASAAAQAVPHPREVFGFEPGADYKLASNAQIVEYFERLDAASDRVSVVQIGESVKGRPMLLAFISSAENVRQLDRWRHVSEWLARARDLDDAAARRLAEEGRAIVWIDGGLHGTEVAGAQHSPLLAWRVATEETPEMRQIRDEVVLLLMPVMNPDGLDIVKAWYERTLDTPFQDTRPPILYHHYVGHDNNRDWYMITMPETKAVARVLYEQWYPQIVYNQHQTAPFPARIFTPPFADPVNPNIAPLVVRGVNQVGIAMGDRFTELGMSGAISRTRFDMWWNGGMRTAPYFHNMVGILTETAHASPTPRDYDPASFPEFFGGTTIRTDHPSVFYPDPWQGGHFGLRDAVDYMVEGALATLDIAAELKEDWLYNIYVMGRDAIAAAADEGPFAYVIPADQWNPREAVNMVNVLRRGGVEVHRATRSFRAGGTEYGEGSYIVYGGQAFRPHVTDLLEPQVYPDMRLYPDGPPDTPYDLTGWTLPLQMHVRTDAVRERFEARTEPVDRAVVAPGEVTGRARWGWALSHRPTASAIAVNRLLAAGVEVAWAAAPFGAGRTGFDAGDILVRRGEGTETQVRALAADLGVDFVGLDEAPAELHVLQPPRIGLYKSWRANMDEGWTRFVLERYEFPVDTLHDADIRSGDLSRYHAIVLPDQGATSILHGHRPGTMPEEYTGGLGLEGAAALKRYVEGGGTVVALDGASDFAIQQFGLPVRTTTEGIPSSEFFVPGTLVRTTVDTSHPIGYGMPREAAAFFVRSSAFATLRPRPGAEGPSARVVARYADEDVLMSGWALGEDRYLAGRAAVVQVPLGAGDVVLFGFRPQFRAQPRATFKLFFNALHGATLAGGAD